MTKEVIGINCVYSLKDVEVPKSDKDDLKVGQDVIFKDEEGKEEHGVVRYIGTSKDKELVISGSKILRPATANDLQRVESHFTLCDRALEVAKKHIKALKLQMYVFRAAYSFDGSKVHLMFTADERVDFRELVKLLAHDLKKQIHLRQIGPRDKAKLIGGYGRCGRSLCCNTFLDRLVSIGMEMVRDQGLESKGSSKLSGACGKLLCCLRYEVEAYREFRKELPDVGEKRKLKKAQPVSPSKNVTVIGLDVLNQKIKVLFENNEVAVIEKDLLDKK